MENTRQHLRYLTIPEILKIADGSITDINAIANRIQQWILPQ